MPSRDESFCHCVATRHFDALYHYVILMLICVATRQASLLRCAVAQNLNSSYCCCNYAFFFFWQKKLEKKGLIVGFPGNVSHQHLWDKRVSLWNKRWCWHSGLGSIFSDDGKSCSLSLTQHKICLWLRKKMMIISYFFAQKSQSVCWCRNKPTFCFEMWHPAFVEILSIIQIKTSWSLSHSMICLTFSNAICIHKKVRFSHSAA